MIITKIKIFADGARIEDFTELSKMSYIDGFTTNPTLMKKAGVKDYEAFIKQVLLLVKEKPISFEVIADDFKEMKRQALKLSQYGKNVYVKIPITNTKGLSSIPLIRELVIAKVKVNVTALFTLKQVKEVAGIFTIARKEGDGLEETTAIVSVFAGRIADTGRDPIPVMRKAVKILKDLPNVELLWASPRELLNLFQAEKVGCDIITVQPAILKKIKLVAYDLDKFSLDTVKMFYTDAVSSGLKL